MALSGTRLRAAEKSGILTQLQTLFPIDASLLTAEKTAIAAAQDKIAEAFAYGGAPATVSEITGNALLASGIVTTGLGAGGAVTGVVA